MASDCLQAAKNLGSVYVQGKETAADIFQKRNRPLPSTILSLLSLGFTFLSHLSHKEPFLLLLN